MLPDAAMVEALRAGDEWAFMELVEAHHASLVRIASLYVPSRAVAEEVAQDTWLAVLANIDRFEQRSSLRTWIFRILVNQAKTRGEKESRSLPFSALDTPGADEPAPGPERFFPPDSPAAGRWSLGPAPWPGPDEELLTDELRAVVLDAIASLPPRQGQVIALRDVEGCSSKEVCEALGISEANQRVLLHRARARVRAAIGQYAAPVAEAAGAVA